MPLLVSPASLSGVGEIFVVPMPLGVRFVPPVLAISVSVSGEYVVKLLFEWFLQFLIPSFLYL